MGLAAATLIIAVTSPLFVRSYPASELHRGVETLPARSVYRWRSEGYADTHVGPLGMPGRPTRNAAGAYTRIALWGDSQAEGVAVPDHQKWFAVVESLGRHDGDAESSVAAYPMARSGDSLDDWLEQMPRVERELSITHHAILICELSDLTTSESRPPLGNLSQPDRGLHRWRPPAFVIQAGKHILTTSDGSFRRLRFRPGRVSIAPNDADAVGPNRRPPTDWDAVASRLRAATSLPVEIVYAPLVPNITGGQLRLTDPSADRATRAASAMTRRGIGWTDRTEALVSVYRDEGVMPHGFHNGRPGSGHLNARGYQAVGRLQSVHQRRSIHGD